MGSAPPGGSEEVLAGVHSLLARLLAFPAATVAAVNGHAYAGGAMLALACDLRVMRADRGFLCLPEVDLGLPFTVGMTALLRAKMTPTTATAAMVFGARYSASDAVEAGLVHAAVDETKVLATAVQRAGALAGKNPAAMRTIKERLYAEPMAALRAEAGPR
jgi:enoyl-CoA hydratase/carnithine racemase